jgi:hypothetical protein
MRIWDGKIRLRDLGQTSLICDNTFSDPESGMEENQDPGKTSRIRNDELHVYCVACIQLCFIGPCQAQQRRRSSYPRNHWGGGFGAHQNHAASAGVPLAFSPEAGDENHLALPSGYQNKPGKAPPAPFKYILHPLQRCQ